MLQVDRVWSRAAQRPEYRGRNLNQYVIQCVIQTYTLTSAQAGPQTPVNFPAGAILLGMIAAAQPTAQAATQTYRPGLDLFTFAMDYQPTNRNIVGTTQGIGSSIFGPYGDQFPAKEIYIPVSGSLLETLTNLTTTTIQVTIGHHVLVPSAIG